MDKKVYSVSGKNKNIQERDEYSRYQEELAFKKELNILRNDFYYKIIDGDNAVFVDFLYYPLDTLSGDAYSARYIDKYKTFYLLVDAMGKGISASLSAITVTAFINYLIDNMKETNSFTLDGLIGESIEYMRGILLDEETISIDFILFDEQSLKLKYAKFSTPPFLMEDNNNKIVKLKSNNPPISKWTKSYKTDEFDISNIEKFLFYSDGIVENETVCQNVTYSNYIEEDFLNSFTREEMVENIFKKISLQEDDFTLIFINKMKLDSKSIICKKEFNTSLDAVDEANEWYEEKCGRKKSSLAFSELFMNAYEHGNLNIDEKLKNRLVEDGSYIDKLLEIEEMCDKKIVVKIFKIKHNKKEYVITQITDEGDGFDSYLLSTIFRNSKRFNGRGVFISRKNSMGIYYNKKGNSVYFIS